MYPSPNYILFLKSSLHVVLKSHEQSSRSFVKWEINDTCLKLVIEPLKFPHWPHFGPLCFENPLTRNCHASFWVHSLSHVSTKVGFK